MAKKKVKIITENFVINPGGKAVGDIVDVDEKIASDLVAGGFVVYQDDNGAKKKEDK